MSRYGKIIGKNLKRAGKGMAGIKKKFKEVERKIKALVRSSHLFAKTRESKVKVAKKLYHVVGLWESQLRTDSK